MERTNQAVHPIEELRAEIERLRGIIIECAKELDEEFGSGSEESSSQGIELLRKMNQIKNR